LLMALWSFAPLDVLDDATHFDVRPTRRMLSARTSAPADAIKKQMQRLCAAGWVRRVGLGIDLAWAVPFTRRRPEFAEATVVMLGRVYAVEFSDGTVKVGRSQVGAVERIDQHSASARSFGISQVRHWISEMHSGCDHVESAMIASLSERHECLNGGEFFRGGFDLAVSTATKLIGGAR
jgi:hypothetical protein